MKAFKLLFMLAVLITAIAASAQTKIDTLTNEKIIQLSKIGLQPSVIITKIHASFNKFDVSTDGLVNLSNSSVAPEVITEMMKADTKVQVAEANQKDMNDPNTIRPTGIYLYNPKDSLHPLRRVDPTVTSTNKTGGFGAALAQAYSAGLAQGQITSSLSGAHSRLQIEDANPVFYFYFENNSNPRAESWFFASATSPNEFALVKFDERKDSRDMAVGTGNAYGSSLGIPNKIKVDYDYSQEAEGVYKVTFKEPLRKGEYCFIYASSTPTRYSNDKVFDFGIFGGEVVDKKKKKK